VRRADVLFAAWCLLLLVAVGTSVPGLLKVSALVCTIASMFHAADVWWEATELGEHDTEGAL